MHAEATSIESDKDKLVDGLWEFVRNRFAYQAKQLRKFTGQPLAKCYDLVAMGHRYSSWRGLKKVIDMNHHMDRWIHADKGNGQQLLAMAILQALGSMPAGADEFDDGSLNPQAYETLLMGVKPLSPEVNQDDIWDEFSDGENVQEDLRELLFYQSLWLGKDPVWSMGAFHTVQNFSRVLCDLWGGDAEKATQATNQVFGLNQVSLDLFWEFKTDRQSLRSLDREVEKVLNNQESSLLPALAEGYRHIRDGDVQRISDWRVQLELIHPKTMDARIDYGPIPVLTLANAPSHCWAYLDLSYVNGSDKDYPARTFGVHSIYAQSLEDAIPCAATSQAVPHFKRVSVEDAEKYGVEHLAGYYELTFI